MRNGQIHYQAAAAVNVVVSAKPAYLHGIIVGADVGSSIIEVSDSKDDGDGNVKIYLADDNIATLVGGYLEVGAVFEKGICADITLQSNVTFVFSNLGLG